MPPALIYPTSEGIELMVNQEFVMLAKEEYMTQEEGEEVVVVEAETTMQTKVLSRPLSVASSLAAIGAGTAKVPLCPRYNSLHGDGDQRDGTGIRNNRGHAIVDDENNLKASRRWSHQTTKRSGMRSSRRRRDNAVGLSTKGSGAASSATSSPLSSSHSLVWAKAVDERDGVSSPAAPGVADHGDHLEDRLRINEEAEADDIARILLGGGKGRSNPSIHHRHQYDHDYNQHRLYYGGWCLPRDDEEDAGAKTTMGDTTSKHIPPWTVSPGAAWAWLEMGAVQSIPSPLTMERHLTLENPTESTLQRGGGGQDIHQHDHHKKRNKISFRNRRRPPSRQAVSLLREIEKCDQRNGLGVDDGSRFLLAGVFGATPTKPGRHRPATPVSKLVTAAQHSTGKTRRNRTGHNNRKDTTDGGTDQRQQPQQQRRRRFLVGYNHSNHHNQCADNNNNHIMSTTSNAGGSKWRTAVDPKSGKTYYFHTETRETQWRKPPELATPDERKAMEEKERQQREFFKAMEANILKSMEVGKTKPAEDEAKEVDFPGLQEQSPEDPNEGTAEDDLARPNLVRTISSMEERVLTDLVKRVPSHRFRGDPMEIEISPNDGGAINRRVSVRLDDLTRRPSLLAKIDETAQESGAYPSIDEAQSSKSQIWEDFDPTASVESFGRQKSLGSMLLDLPEEGGGSGSGDALNKSTSNFGLTTDESFALHELASITEAMAVVDEFDGFDGESQLHMSALSDVVEEDGIDSSERSETESLRPAIDRGLERTTGSLKVSTGVSTPSKLVLERSSGSLQVSQSSGISQNDPADGPAPAQQQRPKMSRPISYRTVEIPLDKPSMMRRNTCGTLYVGSTLSAPDKDATIKCICAVYRAHILQSVREVAEAEADGPESYRIFNDLERQQKGGRAFRPSGVFVLQPEPPALDEITLFYRDVFQRAQMETDCLIMSLIYVERLIKVTGGQLRPRSRNWRSILFSCMVLASKVWDDLSMWNADFSQTCPAGVKFSLQRINELEIAVLSALKYKVKVPASEYAKYYFLLRSMLIKSGLGSEDLKSMNPLDVEGAKRLQHVSSQYQSTATSSKDLGLAKKAALRSKSVGSFNKAKVEKNGNATRAKVGLEHVVKMT